MSSVFRSSLSESFRKLLGLTPSRRRQRGRSVQAEGLETRQLLTARVWDGGGGLANTNMSNRFNWSGDIAPVAGDDLIFPDTAAGKLVKNDFPNSAAGNFKSMTFSAAGGAGAYIVSGNAVRLTGGLSVNSPAGSQQNFDAGVSFQGAGAHSIQVADQATLVLNRAVSSSTAISKSGTGRLVLAGNNTFSGAFNALAGVTQLAHLNALGTTTGATTVTPGAAIELSEFLGSGEEFPRVLTIAEDVSLGGTGIANTGALRNVSGDNRWTGMVTLQAGLNNAIGVDADNGVFAADQLTISGIVKDGATAGFHKVGDGRLILTNNNSYRGSTLIDDGVIRIRNSNALGSALGLTRVQEGAALELDDINLGGGETLSLNIAEPLQLLGTGVGVSGALRNLEGNNVWSGTIALLSPTVISTDRAGDALGIVSVVSGAASSTLQKRGLGGLVMSANNTFSGKTTVQTGFLEVNGNNSSSSVSVVNGKLQGTGSVGPTLIQKDGTISPAANQNGTLNVKGLTSLGTIEITIGQSTSDLINVVGKVDIGASTVVVRGSTGLRGFTIIQNDGTDGVLGTTNGSSVTSTNGQTFAVSYTGGTGNDVALRRVTGARLGGQASLNLSQSSTSSEDDFFAAFDSEV